MRHKLLLVDDDNLLLESNQEFFEKRGFAVDTALSGEEALEKVRNDPHAYSVVIVDFQMTGHNGAVTTRYLLEINPKLQVLVLTASPSQDAVLLPFREKAKAVVQKGEGLRYLAEEVSRLCREYENEVLTVSELQTPAEIESLLASVDMIGCSEALAKVAMQVLRLRTEPGNVMILGETGVGKERVAKALCADERAPFVAKNCALFHGSHVAESELFGHVKGAFTGATANKPGLFEQANGGILYLDEIQELPIPVQAMLLRAIETGEVVPVGSLSTRPVKVNVRVVTAGTDKLEDLIARKAFKPDLYYRISQNRLSVPALRERPADILPLVRHFSAQWNEGRTQKKSLLASVIPYLERYHWPGNVRELSNFIYGIFNSAPGERIGPQDLPASLRTSQGHSRISLWEEKAEVERKALIEAISLSRTIREAAKRLGISHSTVIKKLKKYQIDGKELLRTDQKADRLSGGRH